MCAFVYDFEPYFYAIAPDDFNAIDDVDSVRQQLNQQVRAWWHTVARTVQLDSGVW